MRSRQHSAHHRSQFRSSEWQYRCQQTERRRAARSRQSDRPVAAPGCVWRFGQAEQAVRCQVHCQAARRNERVSFRTGFDRQARCCSTSKLLALAIIPCQRLRRSCSAVKARRATQAAMIASTSSPTSVPFSTSPSVSPSTMSRLARINASASASQ